MKKIVLCLILILSAANTWAQQLRAEVFKTNSSISVASGENIELFSAEGKYSYYTIWGSDTAVYRGPRLKIVKDGTEFVYSVAPASVDSYNAVFYGLSIGTFNSSSFTKSWVFSGDSASLVVEGPASVLYSTNNANNEPFLLTYKKTESTPTNSVSATSVVIPQAATGDVDIKLEQSADNVTWTECLPGTYNSSTVKRFFRLRALEK